MTVILARSAGGSLAARVRRSLGLSVALTLLFLGFLIARSAGAYFAPVDGWGVDVFELAMGTICILRYVDKEWRCSDSVAKTFPVVLGVACIFWALGDLAVTIESTGGATPPVPSVADGFFIGFFPLCFVSFMMVIRRGNGGSLLATSLDGLIAGLGTASLSAAFIFDAVVTAGHSSAAAAATNLIYPVGDLLLLALAVGGLTILPREYRRFLTIASVAMVANAVGDMFNLLQPDSKIGHIANAMAWPVSLLLLAIAAWAQPANAWIPRVSAEKISTERTAGFSIPALGALAGMTVVLAASFGHVGRVGVALATATLFVAGLRLVLSVRRAQALNSARFRSLIDNAWDLIVVAEDNFDVAYITPSSLRILGYAPAELHGRTLTEFTHPDDTGPLLEQLHRLRATTSETATFETRMRHRDGAWRIIAWTAKNLLADPAVHGFVLNGGDVTQTRQAVEDLAAARDGALQASRAKSDFLSTMSHEIRTPMNGVIGLTELLLETALDRDQHELASGVKLSAENLLVIINDILDFSKIEAGKLDVEEAVFSVPSVAEDVGRILASVAHSKGLELLVDVHPDIPTALLGDTVRIQQILLNLASNAVKFTLEGEVVIRVSMLHENNERVALRFDVTDTGLGIAEADQQRLFRPFSQADSSTTRKFGGTGLGLAICRQLVELMGGKLGLISAPGAGSTFWFELSLGRAHQTPPAATSGDLPSLSGQRALVVDDNATNRMILRRQLTSWGVQVVEAVDGAHALQLAVAAGDGDGDGDGGQAFDVGVIDLNMPGMDGIELAHKLKAHPATAGIVLYLLSSSGERLSAGETHLRGFAASMTKPVRPSELFNCLMDTLNPRNPRAAASAPEPPARRNGTPGSLGKILLVEDNKVNQTVGSRVLTKLGYTFDIAHHGGQALQAMRTARYDAILMDCQMPEMDGYEATAEIRRLEGSERHTPIIAMTAAAMEGDRDMCLAAGMDDYITKPVRIDAIAAALARWVAHPRAADTTNPPGSSAGEGPPDALDPLQIDLLRSLDDGEGAVLIDIIEQYLLQTAEARGELATLMSHGDAIAVERAAHALKGASANVGAATLAAVCAEIETRSRSACLDGGNELVEQFDTEFARVRDALLLLTAGP